jgi:hypothetical protein
VSSAFNNLQLRGGRGLWCVNQGLGFHNRQRRGKKLNCLFSTSSFLPSIKIRDSKSLEKKQLLGKNKKEELCSKRR